MKILNPIGSSAKASLHDQTTEYFKLDPLPYPYVALEPVIDRETLQIHHRKHHQSYVDKLNHEIPISEHAPGRNVPLELDELMSQISQWSQGVRNNAGGHWNHRFFWSLLSPPQTGSEIPPRLKSEIDVTFGSVDNFKKVFVDRGESHFGSGWVWLIRNPHNDLEILTTANQENPLMDNAKRKGTPLLTCDLWEHAYYLKYQNRKEEFLQAFWDIVNWKKVEELWVESRSH